MGRLSKSVAALGVAALMAAGGGAYALASSTGATITVCVSHKNGTLYQARKCAKHDQRLSWNQQGLQGAQGRRAFKARADSKGRRESWARRATQAQRANMAASRRAAHRTILRRRAAH